VGDSQRGSVQLATLSLSDDVTNALKYYVYIYVDPRTGQPFYVGKGRGDRMFAHLHGEDSLKSRRIADIQAQGLEPKIDLLRYGLSEDQAHLVEAAAIDLLGLECLTNQVSGFHPTTFPRIDCQEVLSMLSAEPVLVRHPSILITINCLYRSGMTPLELYEATRGIWKVGDQRENIQYALAVYQGVVREVYRIHRWHPAGTLEYATRPELREFEGSGRWEFEGEVAQDIRELYVGRSVGRGNQNPIRYVTGTASQSQPDVTAEGNTQSAAFVDE